MSNASRQIQVTVKGEAVRASKVPLNLLTHVFGRLQDVVNLMGRFHLEKGQISTRGPLPQQVRNECNLHLAATGEGSFLAAIELPEKSQLSLSNGFSSDLGVKSLETLASLLHDVAGGEGDKVRELLPDAIVRNRALRLLRDLAPAAGDQYRIDMAFAGTKTLTLDSGSRTKLTELLHEPITEKHRRFLGRVVELQIEPNRSFHLVRLERRIKCYFGPEVEPVLTQAVGQLVEIQGRAQIDASGRLHSFPEVNDVEIVTLQPLSMDMIVGYERRFLLREPLIGEVSHDQGWFIIENADLSLLAYGETRTEALGEFERDFEVLWQEYVDVPEAELTRDALELRKRLYGMVTEVTQR